MQRAGSEDVQRTPPVLDKPREAKGVWKRFRNFLKRNKQGRKKSSKADDYETLDLREPPSNFKLEDQDDIFTYKVLDDGTEVVRRRYKSETHTDYGTVDTYMVERTQTVSITDTISFRSLTGSSVNSRGSSVSGKYGSSGGIGKLTFEKTPSFYIGDTRDKAIMPDCSSSQLSDFIRDVDSTSLHPHHSTSDIPCQGEQDTGRKASKPDGSSSQFSDSVRGADCTSLHQHHLTSDMPCQGEQDTGRKASMPDVSSSQVFDSISSADSTSLHSTSDISYQGEQDSHSDCKGYPFNVARFLAIKFKVDERFVVPTTDVLGKHTFIIYDKEQGKDRITTELGQKVLYRNPKSIQSEGMTITNYCREKRLYLKPAERALLKNIIQKHTDELFKQHSNINFIGTSPVKSWWNGDVVREEACIVIYCSSKGFIPFGEDKFPKRLTDGEVTVSTDIREGYFQFGPYAYATSRSSDVHDRLKMGCQFGVEGGQGSGTIGPFVNYNGNMGFLTCAHIIYGIDENGYTYDDPAGNIKIEQPASVNFGSMASQCGKVKRAVFKPKLPSSVDAAVVEITEHSRQPVSGEFAVDSPIRMQQAGFDDLPYFNSGRIHMDPNTLDSDKRMVKFGSETHVTRGTLISEGTVVTPVSTEMGLFGHTGRKVLMRNQMEIAGLTSHGAVFQPGDSGSGVFFVDRTNMGQELTCIGMAIGSTSNGTAIVTPIVDILDSLQLPRSLWQFP